MATSRTRLLNKLLSHVPFTHVRHHPTAFVWASSTVVYGLNATSIPAVESDQTDCPINFATAAKKSGEEVTHIYNHIYGISITTLLLSTVYDPWGRPDHPYFTFTSYIDEVVNMSIMALATTGKNNCTYRKKQGSAVMQVYNIIIGSMVPILKVVDILELRLKIKAERKVRKSRAEVVVDISLARRELGFQTTTNLRAGHMRFIKWYIDSAIATRLHSGGLSYKIIEKDGSTTAGNSS